MATPFSPFVGRNRKPAPKRRQSELPSDLIDWDGPEIPELQKQRIIYEDIIRDLKEENQELREEYEVEVLINDELCRIAHEVTVDHYETKLGLLLSQIKISEANLRESDQRISELESELDNQVECVLQKKSEADEFKRKWENVKNQLSYYKKLAKK